MRDALVHLVGAGPGAPGLLTVRGAELLRTADVILHDDLVHPSLLALAREGAEIVYVGKRGHRPADRTQKQAEIEAQLVAHARLGKRVVRLKGGDPYLYGRGSEEAEALVAADIPFEVVPGVCSPLAAAAYAGFSLTHRDLASSVTFVSATQRDGVPFDFGEVAGLRGTLCVLMGVKRLDEVAQDLMAKAGREGSTPAAVIASATLPRQRVVRATLAEIAQRTREAALSSPAILIVGEVVALRDRLRWFDVGGLFGKRVLVPRARGQAADTVELLESRGAEAIAIPLIEIAPTSDPAPLSRALGDIRRYAVVAFTSANAVELFFAALGARGADARALGGVKIASVGPATTRALSAVGLRPDIVPARADGGALGRSIVAALDTHQGARVLFPRAASGREELIAVLQSAGVEVDPIAIYETRAPEPSEREALRARFESGIDAILATSPSTVHHLVDALGESAARLLGGVAIACIGETTADAVRAHALEPALIARPSTLPVLVDALAALYESGA
ncbi:MAG: uroporphyrinogen-III C-methyltransferase [Polyangiaceae bacterium]